LPTIDLVCLTKVCSAKKELLEQTVDGRWAPAVVNGSAAFCFTKNEKPLMMRALVNCHLHHTDSSYRFIICP